jgi:hypothetical protein
MNAPDDALRFTQHALRTTPFASLLLQGAHREAVAKDRLRGWSLARALESQPESEWGTLPELLDSIEQFAHGHG